MKKNIVNYRTIIRACLVISLFGLMQIKADRIVGFYFEPYPGDAENAEKLSNKLQKPGHIAKCILQGHACYSPVAGIFSTYAGYLAHSDVYGFTAFPKKQDEAALTIVITEAITPIFMLANTIHHWQLEPPSTATTYKMEQKTDKQTQMLYWDVQEIPNPKDNIIPIDSLVIIANPKNIFIPTGITLAEKSPNLLLPNIYVKKGIQTAKDAMYMLNLTHLFGPVKTLYKKDKTRLLSLVH